MKFSIRLLIMATIGVLISAQGICQSWQVKSIEPNLDYDNFFVAQDSGWLGADAAYSIVLDDNRILWLFGDTFLGQTIENRRVPEGPHINNCIAIEDRSATSDTRLKYYWNNGHGPERAFFPPVPEMPGDYYWPTSGAIVDNQLVVFCYAMSADELSWWIAGTVVIIVPNPHDDPRDWRLNYHDLGLGDNNLGIHSDVIFEGDYLYLLGYKDRMRRRIAFLARTNARDFLHDPSRERLEYWSNSISGPGWKRSPRFLRALFTPGVTESRIQYEEHWKLYFCTVYDPMQPDIFLTSAPELSGPWSQPVKILTNPDHVTMTYAAKLHPHLSNGPGNLVLSYVTSPESLRLEAEPLNSYRPRFLNIQLERSN